MRRQIRWRRALGQSLAEGALRALAPRPLPIEELEIIRALGPFLAHLVRARTDLVRRLRLQVCEALEARPVRVFFADLGGLVLFFHAPCASVCRVGTWSQGERCCIQLKLVS